MITAADILSARVLIVDDSAVNVLLLERMLHGAGYTAVSTATDSTTVAALHREHHYDLILLDLMMPGRDGFEVMRDLEAVETEGYLPVLVLTAQPAHKLQALRAGAKDFLTKPFDRVEVLTRIHNMLEVRLLLRESRNHGRLLEQYDQLTGLPNRRLYRELLTRVLARSEEQKATVSVLFITIDRFKTVSDALGRGVGGTLLRHVGDLLVGCVGPMDTVARLEGAEFGLVVVTPAGDAHDAGITANRVREALRPSLVEEGHDVALTASVGIAMAPGDGTDADALLKCAAMAVQRARDAGGDTYRFYSAEMNASALSAMAMETALRHALERGEFVLHYQPKVQVADGAWSGVEALLRWERPGHGLIAPGAFVPLLEETGMIVQVGTWVIEEACRQIGAWSRNGMGRLRVAVNVSGKQFLRAGFVASIGRAIRDHDIEPSALDIEITESSLMTQHEEAELVLRELRNLGVSIAIDDFGTGYSSLAYLQRFPINTLKIDISFIRDITDRPDGGAIALAIINMARSLHLRVVAEGVETEPQLAFLRNHACDEIQGFYYSRPVTADALAALRAAPHAGVLATAP